MSQELQLREVVFTCYKSDKVTHNIVNNRKLQACSLHMYSETRTAKHANNVTTQTQMLVPICQWKFKVTYLKVRRWCQLYNTRELWAFSENSVNSVLGVGLTFVYYCECWANTWPVLSDIIKERTKYGNFWPSLVTLITLLSE